MATLHLSSGPVWCLMGVLFLMYSQCITEVKSEEKTRAFGFVSGIYLWLRCITKFRSFLYVIIFQPVLPPCLCQIRQKKNLRRYVRQIDVLIQQSSRGTLGYSRWPARMNPPP